MIPPEHALAGPAAALFVSWALLAVLVRRQNLLADVPNERSLHSRPVPRTGGIAISAGVLGTGAFLPGLQPLVVAAACMALVSLLDDWRPLPVLARLAAHFAIAGALVGLSLHAPALPEAVFLVLTLVWLANLYNFMDGSDGLAGGMAAIGFGAYAVAAWHEGDWVLATFSAATACAALPFLFYNFHPARIFMGDVGSVTLGFLAGAVGIAGWQAGTWPLLFPLLVFSPFIADATLTLLQRVLRKEKFWRAHREHYYQKLVRLGLGHRNTALLEYLAMLLGCAAALALLAMSPAMQLATGMTWLAVLLAVAFLIDRSWRRHDARSGDA